jgi:hypothetical protein
MNSRRLMSSMALLPPAGVLSVAGVRRERRPTEA